MASISALQLTHAGHNTPLGWGLPHLGHKGGVKRGKELQHSWQIKAPSLPHPTHRRGNKRSSAILLTWLT